MEIFPVILKNIIYDRETRRFHTDQTLPHDIKSLNYTFEICEPISTRTQDTLFITQPTYALNHFHSCFGHAYLDTFMPLLSILYEYDYTSLNNRDYKLFIFKEIWSDIDNDPSVQEFYNKWIEKYVDYTEGTLKGGYEIFHKAISNSPILFEKCEIPQRFIYFSTLLYGGNLDNQRCIHNSSIRYPGRRNAPPTASDIQLLDWILNAKNIVSRYLHLNQINNDLYDTTLLVARKYTRAFTDSSLRKMKSILEQEPIFLEDISFRDQILEFQSAKYVVAAHGSGLCHLIWCKPGTEVIEIFKTRDPRMPIFESLCSLLGLKYTRIICDESDDSLTDNPIELSSSELSRILSIVAP